MWREGTGFSVVLTLALGAGDTGCAAGGLPPKKLRISEGMISDSCLSVRTWDGSRRSEVDVNEVADFRKVQSRLRT